MSVIDGQWSVTDGRELGIENARDRRFVLSRQADGCTAIVAKVWSDGDGYEDTARLVAAAPELLAALIKMRDEFCGSAECRAQDDAWAFAQEVIEKAGGER